MSPAGFTVFSQELYYDESIQAIVSYADAPRRRELHARIVDDLPHTSTATRKRIATKIIQRYFVSPDGSFPSTPFLKLVSGTERKDIRLDLLYWRAARTDAVIEAVAGELFYPYFVLGTVPQGYTESEFHMANTATLFSVDSVITRDFAVEYARKVWSFDSPRSITLALRIMRQAEILDAVSVTMGRRRVHGYYPLPHTPRVEVFGYCLYEEFLEESPLISTDRLRNSAFAKIFLLSGLQMDSLAKMAERKRLLAAEGRYWRLTKKSLAEVVETLKG